MINEPVTWTPGETLEEVERKCIKAALQFYRGNKTATAQSLGIAIRTLDNKIEKYGQEEALREAKRIEDEQEYTRKRIAFSQHGGEALEPRPKSVPLHPTEISGQVPTSEGGHQAAQEAKRARA